MALNMWDLVECLELHSLLHHPRLLLAIGFGFVSSIVKLMLLLFLAFSRVSFMQIDGAEWPLPLQCFPCVFGLGLVCKYLLQGLNGIIVECVLEQN